MLKQILSSFLIGGSVVMGPYALATQIPTSQVKKAKGEGVGFGERCLFDEEICALMKETKFEEDKETENSDDTIENGESNSQNLDTRIKKRVNKEWKNFLKKQDNDYCGFGFLEPHPSQRSQKQKDINVNNLEKCWKFLTEDKGKKKK
ncbi:hypothetical protein DNK47_01995 [Mycoplasma wenyonii]|uniref:Uncharacterized protein n=1 Tax=Mycoplasma wenyonii TaxID=65123 RepID=A0A328PMU1_9MOLU|nr:hypothetical protein [Mycoplasma wenyonii]RAO95035.1 hypothetical protein DNK47_01995 [Mycoplasma wenyonii]